MNRARPVLHAAAGCVFVSAVLSSCGGGGGTTVGGAGGGGGTSNDPLFVNQWHLENTGQEGGVPGEDSRVPDAWARGFDGTGVVMAIVDDGLEIGHEDIAPNVVAGSFDYRTNGSDPTGGSHGTSCGGVAAAALGNGIGVAGAAGRASVMGFNLLTAFNTSNQVDAILRRNVDIWVSSNSWGFPDGTGAPMRAANDYYRAVSQGVDQGRNGLGTIYVFAAGNGHGGTRLVDNSNHDGFTSHRGIMAIGAIGDDGVAAEYSEPGTNVWVCAHSMGRGNHGITTVDRSGPDGYNAGQSQANYSDPNYHNAFNGTSSATPLVSGVCALVLQAAPMLTWRDVRQVIAKSARKNDPNNPGWQTNAAGMDFHQQYGFGAVDADAAVSFAETWVPIGPEVTVFDDPVTVNVAIPDNDPAGLRVRRTVSNTGIQNLEWLELLIDIRDHTYSHDLDIRMISPSGTEAILVERHSGSMPRVPYENFIFGVASFLDEPADGEWQILVSDRAAADVGTLTGIRLGFYGR